MELQQFPDGNKLNYFFGSLLAVLFASFIPSFSMILSSNNSLYFPMKKSIQENPAPPISFELPLIAEFSGTFMGDVRSKISIFKAPFSDKEDSSNYMICLKPDQIQKFQIPSRLNVTFGSSGNLFFAKESSGFWLDLNLEKTGEIEFALFFLTPDGQNICQDRWKSFPKEAPLFSSNEIKKEGPFGALVDAKFYGSDLFAEKYGETIAKQLIEIPSENASSDILHITSNDWLIFKDAKWQIVSHWNESDSYPVAKIRQIQNDHLELEGFDGSIGFRFQLPLISHLPLKLKTDELFTRLRVRSEKQISCMIEKQCFILRPNDWVLKSNGRWKILRKMEEKQSYLTGKLNGEILVLDQIFAKEGAKSISGSYFSAGRTQMMPYSIACTPTRNIAGLTKQGKAK